MMPVTLYDYLRLGLIKEKIDSYLNPEHLYALLPEYH
jgi:hypothetical protein